MRTNLLLTACFLLLAASLASGITLEEARRQTEAARDHVNRMERQLRDAQNDLEHARRDLEELRRRHQQLPRQIDQSKKEIQSLQDRLDDARKATPEARNKIGAANQQVKQTREGMTEANRCVQDAQAKAEDMKQRLWQQYQATPAYQSAASNQAVAHKKLDDTSATCLETLGKTPTFQQAVATAAKREAELNVLRASDAEQPALADASLASMRAKFDVEQMKKAALSADIAVRTAGSALAEANAVLKGLKEKFDEEIKSDPEMSPLLAGLAKAKKDADSAQANLKAAQGSLRAAEDDLKQRQAAETAAKIRLDQEETDLVRMQRSLADVDRDLKDAQRRIDNFENDVRRLRRERDRAEEVLKDKQQQENRVRNSGDGGKKPK